MTMADELTQLIVKSTDRENPNFVTPSIAALVVGRNGTTTRTVGSSIFANDRFRQDFV